MMDFSSKDLLSWSAVVVLSLGYWFQVWRIHVHKEVRDLSLATYIALTIGFGVLGYQAWIENSLIFIVKQITTFIPCAIIVAQIFTHQDDHWHDDNDELCRGCREELEPHWTYCPFCSHDRNNRQEESV